MNPTALARQIPSATHSRLRTTDPKRPIVLIRSPSAVSNLIEEHQVFGRAVGRETTRKLK